MWGVAVTIGGMFLTVYIPIMAQIESVITVIMTYFILYSMYALATVLHWIWNYKNMTYRYLVLYPFTFDGKWRFQPIKLLYFPEMVRDILPINLYDLYVQNSVSQDVNQYLKKLKSSRYISRFLAVFIVLSVLGGFGFSFPWWTYLVMCGLISIQSYCGKNTQWIGNNAMLYFDKFEEILLSKEYIRVIPSKYYYIFLKEKYNNVSLENLIKIIFNYCYALKDCQTQAEDELLINDLIRYFQSEIYGSGIGYFVRFHYLLYLIGLVGVKNSEKLKLISKANLLDLMEDTVCIPKKHSERVQVFLNYLDTGDGDLIDFEDYVISSIYIFDDPFTFD